MASFWEHTKKERPIFGIMGYGGGVGSSLISGAGGEPGLRTIWICGTGNHGALGLNQYAPSPGGYTQYSSPMQIGTQTNWSQIFRGPRGAMAITNTNELFSWGNNGYGICGTNKSYSNDPGVNSPTKIPGSWKYAYVGDGQACAINTAGNLFVWGMDRTGGLGLNESPWVYTDPTDYEQYQRPNYYSSPVQMSTDTNWKMAQVREYGGGGVKTDGTAWCWGYCGYGNSGRNQPSSTSSPVQMGGNSDYWSWITFRAGSSWSNGIKQAPWQSTGSYYVWGYNGDGALGMNEGGYDGDYSSPMQMPNTSMLPEFDNGTATGGNVPKPQSMPFTTTMNNGCNIIRDSGNNTTGSLWVTGSGANGYLGLNESWNPTQPWAQYPRYSSMVQCGTDTDWSQIDDQAGMKGDRSGNDVNMFVWGHHGFGILGISCGYKWDQPWTHCGGRSSPTSIGSSLPGTVRDMAYTGFRAYEA